MSFRRLLATLLALLPTSVLAGDNQTVRYTDQHAQVFKAKTATSGALARPERIVLERGNGQRWDFDLKDPAYEVVAFPVSSDGDDAFIFLVDSGKKWAYLPAHKNTPSLIVVELLQGNKALGRWLVEVPPDVPPGPPGPLPPKPKPDWKYMTELTAVWAKDVALGAKATDAASLGAIYRRAASYRPDSIDAAYAWLQIQYSSAPDIPNTRTLLSSVLVLELGKSGAATLTDAQVKAWQTLTGKIADCLAWLATAEPPAPPGPGPAPDAQKLFIVIVEESSQAAENRGQWFADKALAQRIKDKGHTWKFFDKDVKNAQGQMPEDLAPYIQRSAGKTLPQLYLVGPTGKVWFEGNLPATPADLITLMTKYGG